MCTPITDQNSPQAKHRRLLSDYKSGGIAGPGWRLRGIIRTLNQGGIIAYPTEAVYGLGCDPLNQTAVMRLLALKQRPQTKGLILIAASFRQITTLIDFPKTLDIQPVLDSWPGPVTWVFPAAPRVPDWLCSHGRSIAVRVTSHPLSAAVCTAFGGPIVSTSANPGGRPPARTTIQARRYFATDRVLVVNGDTAGLRQPSRIFDALSRKQLR